MSKTYLTYWNLTPYQCSTGMQEEKATMSIPSFYWNLTMEKQTTVHKQRET